MNCEKPESGLTETQRPSGPREPFGEDLPDKNRRRYAPNPGQLNTLQKKLNLKSQLSAEAPTVVFYAYIRFYEIFEKKRLRLYTFQNCK